MSETERKLCEPGSYAEYLQLCSEAYRAWSWIILVLNVLMSIVSVVLWHSDERAPIGFFTFITFGVVVFLLFRWAGSGSAQCAKDSAPTKM